MLTAFWLLSIVGALALIQGLASLRAGIALLRYTRREMGRTDPPDLPRVAVFLPCKGVDDHLEATIRGAACQDYPDYELICAVESASDPAWEVIQRFMREHPRRPVRCVVAPPAQECSQKICNLLAAIRASDPRTQVYAFLDSDAQPPAHWLRALVAPLLDGPTGPAAQSPVGATTGFRWYVPRRSVISLLRCGWNAAPLAFLCDPRTNFCWGGSMALWRDTFERLNIARRWAHALSEDYEVTRAVREAGLAIHFVPRCLLPSDDRVGWREFCGFAVRQLIITRMCHRPLWTAAVVLAVLFNAGFWGLGALALPLAGKHPAQAGVAGGTALAVYALALAKGALRQRAVALMLPAPELRRGALLVDAVLAPLIGLLHLPLMAASALTSRFWWRGVRYALEAGNRVRVLARRDSGPSPDPVPGSLRP